MDRKHIVSLQGRDYPLWAGVLAEAHELGLIGIATRLVQIPSEENGQTAIVKAIVTMRGGGPTDHRTFEAYGDASPKNVASRLVTALIRFAETRAKGRALRDACNIGEVMAEELAPEDREEAPRVARTTPATPARARVAETLAANEQPIPIERPIARHEPGFEEVYEADGKSWKRGDLVAAAIKAQEQALAMGLKIETVVPHQTPNAELIAWGKRVRSLLPAPKVEKPAEEGVAA